MIMLRDYKYRIKPTKKQGAILRRHINLCCQLYNKLLEQRIQVYEDSRKNLSCFDQCRFITILKKKDFTELQDVSAQSLQNVAIRLDFSFKEFFRKLKKGGKAGFPRFKTSNRYNSITFPQYPSCCPIIDDRISVWNVGHVKMRIHRPIEGRIKTVTIKVSSTGKWFVTFSCEVEKVIPVHHSKESVAFDLGINTFAFLSDGSKIKNPRFYRKEQKDLTRAQRKGVKKVVARIHERIQNKRRDFCIKTARSIVAKYSTIFMENLEINRMVQNHILSKSIHDAGWDTFTRWLLLKAEEAGAMVIKVNPAYTSQDCSSCGHRERKTLGEREHECRCCHFKCDRDLNAALNILRLGQQSNLARERSLS